MILPGSFYLDNSKGIEGSGTYTLKPFTAAHPILLKIFLDALTPFSYTHLTHYPKASSYQILIKEIK